MSDMTTLTVDKPYLAVGGVLLEGPAYNARRNQLRWVDIAADRVHLLNLSDDPATLQTFQLEKDTIATLYDSSDSDNSLLVGAKYGFATFDVSSGEIKQFRSYYEDDNVLTDRRRFRANDGAVDARGRILQGVMIDDRVEPTTKEGMLLSLDLDGRLRRLVDGVVCPNGLGWNKKNTIMYWAESGSGNVYAFDYDIDTGNPTAQRVFFHLHGENNTNVPDGLVVDEEDHIWLAVWGGSRVLRISPEGVVVAKIELPTRFITCPVFVGSDLFITTAVEREPENYPSSAEFGGQLYRCSVGVRGLPKFECLPISSYLSQQTRTA